MHRESRTNTGWPGRRFAWVILVYLYVLPVVLPALGCYFDPDDISNLYYHRFQRPPSEAVVKSILFFLPYRRPVGGCLYLLLYDIFGLNNPLPYYVTGLLIFAVNIALLFWLLLRLTDKVSIAILACSLASVHGAIIDIWYSFGTVYELLAFGLMLASFHSYLFYLSRRGVSRWAHYSAAIILYLLAIGSKEMAVTLPALLLAYEWIYRTNGRKRWSLIYAPCLRLFPFFLVALVAVIGRILANPHEGPLYAYHFDGTMLDNLCRYVEMLFYGSFALSRGELLIVLILALAVAVLLRSRHMIFGWLYFMVGLSPVIPLPRVSGFFLYLPMVGVALYLGSLLVDLGNRLWQAVCRATPSAKRFSASAAAAGVLLCLVGLVQLHHTRIRTQARDTFLSWGPEFKRFDRQLFSKYADFQKGTALLFLRKPHVEYTLHQTILLHYRKPESELHIWASPNLDLEAFKQSAAPESHVFDYEDGNLVELKLKDLETRKIKQ